MFWFGQGRRVFAWDAWKAGDIERVVFGFSIFCQCQPDDVITVSMIHRFLKSTWLELQDFRNSSWELIKTGFVQILHKPTSDILSEESLW